MRVEERAIADVTPYPGNPRVPGKAVAKVRRSIEAFGWRQPIVVDEAGVVIVGHTRLLAARELGLAVVPVHVAEGLTPEQARAYRLADNRVHEESGWDEARLVEELQALTAADFDLADTGFEQREVTRALVRAAMLDGRGDEAAPPVPEVPVSQLGDVWLLGSHRLMCGDSCSDEAVAELLGGATPHLMVTDPPYGVHYDPSWRARMSSGLNVDYLAKELDTRAAWPEVWRSFPGDTVYVWHRAMRGHLLGLEEAGFEQHAEIVWWKKRAAIGRGHFSWGHESCWYGWRAGRSSHWQQSVDECTTWGRVDEPVAWNCEECGASSAPTVWELAHPASVSGHATQKPLECMLRPILLSSERGDGVYEPFAGTGTTIIAAEKSERICYAMEIDPRFVDVCVRRWEEFTGLKAKLGRLTFDTVAKRRAA